MDHHWLPCLGFRRGLGPRGPPKVQTLVLTTGGGERLKAVSIQRPHGNKTSPLTGTAGGVPGMSVEAKARPPGHEHHPQRWRMGRVCTDREVPADNTDGPGCAGGGGWRAGRGQDAPQRLRLRADQAASYNSQHAALGWAPGCWPAGETALTSPGPRPCPPAGHQNGAAGRAGVHSSQRSASCFRMSNRGHETVRPGERTAATSTPSEQARGSSGTSTTRPRPLVSSPSGLSPSGIHVRAKTGPDPWPQAIQMFAPGHRQPKPAPGCGKGAPLLDKLTSLSQLPENPVAATNLIFSGAPHSSPSLLSPDRQAPTCAPSR